MYKLVIDNFIYNKSFIILKKQKNNANDNERNFKNDSNEVEIHFNTEDRKSTRIK